MTDQETKEYVDEMKKYTKKIATSSKKSKDFLVKAGICTPKGNLKKPYK
jgi:hypothetical protein